MRREIRTSGEATPNFPSAPARFAKRRIYWALRVWTMVANIGTVMKKILNYIKSVRSEWFKIVWPSRDTVVRATIMILVFSGLAALFFFIVDSILNTIVGWIF